MRFQRHTIGELAWHGVGMTRDVADLAPGKPIFQPDHQHQESDESQRKDLRHGLGSADRNVRAAQNAKARGLPCDNRAPLVSIAALRSSNAEIMSQPPLSRPRGERYSDTNLVWVDMEMSGLNPDSDRVLEVAMVITDAELEIVAEGPVIVVRHLSVLLGMELEHCHSWPFRPDGRYASTLMKKQRPRAHESLTHVPLASPMCGNSIVRIVAARWMPRPRRASIPPNLDVSTLKELARRWNPAVYRSFERRADTKPSPTSTSRSTSCATTANWLRTAAA
jgi:oligoribonuclease